MAVRLRLGFHHLRVLQLDFGNELGARLQLQRDFRVEVAISDGRLFTQRVSARDPSLTLWLCVRE